MNNTEKIERKCIAGLIITEELSHRLKGTIHVAWTGKDARISIADENGEFYAITYKGLGSFIESSYVMLTDLDLIVDDVIKDFTLAIYESFFKNI